MPDPALPPVGAGTKQMYRTTVIPVGNEVAMSHCLSVCLDAENGTAPNPAGRGMIHQSAPRVHQSIKYRSAMGEGVSGAKASAAMWSSGRRWTGATEHQGEEPRLKEIDIHN
jgi:hypothetical protein